MISDKTLFNIIIILAIISSVYEVYYSKKNDCVDKVNPIQLFSLVFIHYVLIYFTYIALLSGNTKILQVYVLYVTGVTIHWKLNNDLCILSVIQNRWCGYPDDTRMALIQKAIPDYTQKMLSTEYKLMILLVTFALCRIVHLKK